MIIQLKDINKTYPGIVPLHVLKDINLDIDRGELVSIMGASGSGKSTLLNILGILDNYDSGEYHLDGVLIKDLSENRAAELRNRLIGFVFQSFNLISYKNAVENVALPLFYQGVSRRKRNALAMEQLERMGLADRAHHLPGELSGSGEPYFECYFRDGFRSAGQKVTGCVEPQAAHQFNGRVVGESFDFAIELRAPQPHHGGELVDVEVGVGKTVADEGEEAAVELVFDGRG